MTATLLCAAGASCADKTPAQSFATHDGREVVLARICDSAKVAAHMAAHPDRWEAAFAYLGSAAADTAALGEHELLPGREVFAIVSRYEPRPADSCRFEAHRRYIDLQYLVSGTEDMGITVAAGLNVIQPYSADADIEFYSPEGVGARYDRADPGRYYVFFPDDPHRPSMSPKSDTCTADSVRNRTVRKVVVKILY